MYKSLPENNVRDEAQVGGQVLGNKSQFTILKMDIG